MNVAVIGGGFVNKGGELMSIAVREMLLSWNPSIRLYMPVNSGSRSWRSASGFGTLLYLDSDRLRNLSRMIRVSSSVAPGTRRVVPATELDVVLDISGFAYGDAWGPSVARRRAEAYCRWQEGGTRVVLMPQAFGPFTGKAIRRATGSILSSASLCFARDPLSERHLQDLAQPHATVMCAPDFTNLLVPGEDVTRPTPPAPVALVPNSRMLDMTNDSGAQRYLRFMRVCVEHLAETIGVYILIHGDRDSELAQRIAAQSPSGVEIVSEADPLALKAYLGSSLYVVASRYHALVSALSCGVPVLAVGWSHKYGTLLAEYHQLDNLLTVDASPVEIRRRLDCLASAAVSAETLADLQSAGKLQRRRTERMWAMVRAATGI